MEIKSIEYTKTFNLGNYQNEKIGIVLTIGPDENPALAYQEARNYVEHAHLFTKQYPDYERAKQMVANPMNYRGYDVEEAKQQIRRFEEQFSRFMDANGQPKLPIPAGSEENSDYQY